MQRTSGYTTENLAWGVRGGVFYGVIFGAIAGLFLVLRGGELPASSSVSVPVFLAAYPALGLAAGLVVGFTRGWMTSMRRATLVGVVAAWPTAFVFLAVSNGPVSLWRTSEWVTTLLGAALFGYMGARQLWSKTAPKDVTP